MHRAGIEPERKCLVARQITQIDLQNNASLCNLVVMKCQKFPLEVKVGSAVVKIYHGKVKHGGKKYDLFTLAYYQNGKRQRETFGNFDDAKKAADQIALKIAQGRANMMELNGPELESYNATMNLLRPHNLPLHSVVQEYLAAREHLGDEPLLSAVNAQSGFLIN